MRLIGCMPVRNEDWILGLSARVALMWCDALVIFLHACTDDSEVIANKLLAEYGERVLVCGSRDDKWDEMSHRQMMLGQARAWEATHIALTDADEVLTANLLPKIRDVIEHTPLGHILHVPGYNLRGGLHRYHANGVWGNRWFSVAFADDPRLQWSGDKFHQREPGGALLIPRQWPAHGDGGVLHCWGASERRLIARHRLYKIVEHLRWPDKSVELIERMYNWATLGDPKNPAFGTPATWTYAPVPSEWWTPYADLMGYLDVEREPWQIQECERLIALHGREKFAGLSI